jgi:hypothetical protein
VNNAQGTLLATRRQVADKIANGHGYDDHIWEFGLRSREEYRDAIERVLGDPMAQVIPLKNRRTAFYDGATNTIVLVDPNRSDNGRAFRPRRGPSYLETLE